MNWLLIYHEKDEMCEELFNFLKANKIVPNEYKIGELCAGNVKALKDATHCAILDGCLSVDCGVAFVSGFLAGSDKEVYSVGNGWLEKMSDFKKMNLFSSSSDLISYIKQNFESIKAEDKKHRAWASLFYSGVPFTSNCFAMNIAKDNRAICELFIEAGMNVNERTETGTPMLNVAIRNEKEDAINWLLSFKDIDIDAVSTDRGYSAVMDAVWKNDIKTTKILISRGANLNFLSNDGQSALVIAVGAGRIDICKILAEGGCDVDIKDVMGMSAYDYSKLFKRDDITQILEKYHKKS